MTADTPVRLTKQSTQNPGVLPDSYWLEGTLYEDVRIGATIIVHRHRRARQRPEEPAVVEVQGLYVSSPVRELIPQPGGGVLAVTQNSHWLVEVLPNRPDARSAEVPSGRSGPLLTGGVGCGLHRTPDLLDALTLAGQPGQW